MTALVDVIEETERAQVMLHPARLDLLDHLEQPASAATLARQMGLPRQRVNYHLRELERQRLVELVEERRRGSVAERIYQRTGRAYAISTAALGRLGSDPDMIQDRFSSAYQIALASRAVRDLGAMQVAAAAAGKKLPTLAAEVAVRFASPAERSAFAEELSDAVAELVKKYHDESADDGRWFQFYLGAYPRKPDREDDGSPDES